MLLLLLLLVLLVVRKKVICTNVCLLSFGRLHCTTESLLHHQPGSSSSSSSYILMRRRFRTASRVCVCAGKHERHFVGTECGLRVFAICSLDNSRRRGSPSSCQYQISWLSHSRMANLALTLIQFHNQEHGNLRTAGYNVCASILLWSIPGWTISGWFKRGPLNL